MISVTASRYQEAYRQAVSPVYERIDLDLDSVRTAFGSATLLMRRFW